MNTEALQGTYARMPDGSWGIRSADKLEPGDPVEVFNRTRGKWELRYVVKAWQVGRVWFATIENNKD